MEKGGRDEIEVVREKMIEIFEEEKEIAGFLGIRAVFRIRVLLSGSESTKIRI